MRLIEVKLGSRFIVSILLLEFNEEHKIKKVEKRQTSLRHNDSAQRV